MSASSKRPQFYDDIASTNSIIRKTTSGETSDRLSGLVPLALEASGASILDIGTNTGDVAEFFGRIGAASLWGLDFYRPGLAEARRKFEHLPQSSSSFIECDLAGGSAVLDAALKGAPDQFDIVLYLGVHHHFKRQMEESTLSELMQSLLGRTKRFFAARVPKVEFTEVDSVVRARGFVPWYQDQTSDKVGRLAVYGASSDVCTELQHPKLNSRYERIKDVLSDADVLFLSIQKSGRTWVRFFLQEYFSKLTGEILSLAPREMARTAASPSIGFVADFFDLYEYRTAEPCLLFEVELRSKPLILLVRDPRDVVVSAYHYTHAKQPELFSREIPSGSLSEYADSEIFGVERIAAFHQLELGLYARHRGPKMLLTYEGLLADPRAEFKRLVEFLSKSEFEPQTFEAALSASEFQAMQALEMTISAEGRTREYFRLGAENWSGDVNDLKVRSGKVGSWQSECPHVADAARYPQTAAALALGVDAVRMSDVYHAPEGIKVAGRFPLAERLAAKIKRLSEALVLRNNKIAMLRRKISRKDEQISKLSQQLSELGQADTVES